MRYLAIVYSIASYLIGVAALACLILFVGDVWLPVTVNKASALSPELSGVAAAAVNLGLIVSWGFLHSLMADPRFKARWTRIVPIMIERSTFVLFAAFTTFALMALWSPMTMTVWDLGDGIAATILWVTFWSGWAILLLSTYLINHFELFGLSQAFRAIRSAKPKADSFVTPFFYRWVRHPMMTGILIALWSAPELSVGRLVFNLAMTAYIVIGTSHEEKTLTAELGNDYELYRKRVPKLVPSLSRRNSRRI